MVFEKRQITTAFQTTTFRVKKKPKIADDLLLCHRNGLVDLKKTCQLEPVK